KAGQPALGNKVPARGQPNPGLNDEAAAIVAKLEKMKADLQANYENKRLAMQQQLQHMEAEHQAEMAKIEAERAKILQKFGQPNKAVPPTEGDGDKLDCILEKLERLEKRMDRLEKERRQEQ